MKNIIAIGDIHGCFKQLNEILEQSKQYPRHELVFLGDYIDRGPESEKVCRTLDGKNGIFLKGNHEEMLIRRAINNPSKISELLQIAQISIESLEWICKSLQAIYSTEDYIFVHAGLNCEKGLDEQSEHDYLWTRWSDDYYCITKKLVIHGHSVIKDPEMRGNRLNINTGCGSGGYLTAVVLPEMIYLKSSISEGKEFDWEKIKLELESELEELEQIDENCA